MVLTKYFYIITPTGTLLTETKAPFARTCVLKFLASNSHLPFAHWADFATRGYTIELFDAISKQLFLLRKKVYF